MTAPLPIVEDVLDRAKSPLRYSICTLVTHPTLYESMLRSFADGGFDAPDCEFLRVDNVQHNRLDAYQACNLFLNTARGAYVVICHQDVVLMDEGRSRLDAVIAELDALDERWAVFGNSGGVAPGRHAVRISDPHGENQKSETLPARVASLDENFIVARRDANLALSHDLSGFHLYGTDLCILADILGRTSYVVDFHLRHLSGGVSDESFARGREALAAKYARAFRPRWIMTPSAMLFLSGARAISHFANTRPVRGARRRLGRFGRPRDGK